MSMKTAKRLTYFDLDELGDASQIIEMKLEDAESLLTKEEGLFRKFKSLVPKVEKVTKSIEEAAKRVTELRDGVADEMSEVGKASPAVASELLKIARELMAASQAHGFTELKPIKFRDFHGTASCLNNAKMIKDAGYELVDGYFAYDTTKGDYKTTAFFTRGDESQTAEFFGFSIGYGGEGPRGMMEFGRIFGWSFDEENVFGRKLVENADPGSIHLKNL